MTFTNQMKYVTRKELFGLKVAIINDMRQIRDRMSAIENFLVEVSHEMDTETPGDGHAPGADCRASHTVERTLLGDAATDGHADAPVA